MGAIVLAIAAILYFVLSGANTPNDTLGSGSSDNATTNVEQAAQLETGGIDMQRDTEQPLTNVASGTSSLEFYFASDSGVNGGVLTLNDETHSFARNYLLIEDIASGAYSIDVAVEHHLLHEQLVNLEADESKTVNITLDPAVILRGRVVDHNGKPLANAVVAGLEDVVDDSLYALAIADFFNYGNLPDWTSDDTLTDENGEFILKNLKPASFNILVADSAYLPFKTESAYDLTLEADITASTIALQPGMQLKLHVVDTLQQPIANASVQWRPNSLLANTIIQRSDDIPIFTTDEAGIVVLKAMPNDVLSVSAYADGFALHTADIDLSVNSNNGVITHTLTLSHGVSVSGTILNADGKPCVNSKAALIPKRDFNIQAVSADKYRLQSDADENGRYQFSGIGAGEYYLAASADEYSRQVLGPFDVSDSDLVDFDVIMQHGARLIVTVLDSEDVPLDDITVAAVSVTSSSVFQEQSDEQGMVTLSNLTAGNYQVSSVDASSGGNANVQFKFVTLLDDETTTLTLGGKQATATLSGTVTRAGEQIHRARISIITDSGAKVAATDEEGKYSIEDMPLGDFILIVNVTSGLNGNSAFYDSLLIDKQGEVEHNIELPDAGLEVHVTRSSDNSEVVMVPVSVRPINGTNISGGDFGLTDANGFAKFPSLNDGEYMVSVGNAAASFLSPSDNGLGSKIVSGISVRQGQGVQRIEVALGQGATVKIQVRNQAGELLSGVHMHYLDANGHPMNIISMNATNAKGVAQLKGLPSGPGRIMVRHPEIGLSEFEVNLSDGALHKEQVALETGTKLMVTVVDENDQPLKGVLCTALDSRGAALSYVWAMSETQATQSAYFSGTAQKLGPLPVGNYKIQLIRPGKDIVIHEVFVNGESVQNLRLRFNDK
ncbi:MAG: hypothetical protein ACI84O_000903 [Myxococcota bacterium]|jgi:hypothetical protein